MSNGIIYSAYGENAIREALKSIASVKQFQPETGICVMTDETKSFRHNADVVVKVDSDDYGRQAKLSADLHTPFKNTLYLDADTRVWGDLSPIWYWLNSGFEFVATLSARQGNSWLWQVEDEIREKTIQSIGFTPAQLQGGVWGFRRTPKVKSFMAAWRNEYQNDAKHDQPALSRAFNQKPMKTLIIGHDFNGSGVIHHLFGRAER